MRDDRGHLRAVRPPRPRVVIAGGGVAAIEALLALRHTAGGHVAISLLAPERRFVHRPSSVAGPFGFGGPAALELATLARDHDLLLAEQDASFGDHRQALHALDAAAALAGGVLPDEWVAHRERRQRELAGRT